MIANSVTKRPLGGSPPSRTMPLPSAPPATGDAVTVPRMAESLRLPYCWTSSPAEMKRVALVKAWNPIWANAQQGERPTKSQTKREHAHVFHTRVGQQPFDVLLSNQEGQSDGDAEKPEQDEQVRREGGAQPGRGHEVEADQGVELSLIHI